MAVENIVHANNENWKTEVLESKIPVLVDFWAEWCGPCRALAPILDQLAVEMTGKLKIVKVDVDSNQDLAAQFGIRAIPTLLFFRGGKVQSQMVGGATKAVLQEKLQSLLGG